MFISEYNIKTASNSEAQFLEFRGNHFLIISVPDWLYIFRFDKWIKKIWKLFELNRSTGRHNWTNYLNKEWLLDVISTCTCTCIGFHPGRVKPASSRASTVSRTIENHVAHWRRYFGIWLKEGSQVLPGKTPCLLEIFHRRIDRATRGLQLPEQTHPGFSPEPLLSGCGVLDQSALGSPTRNRSSRQHNSGTTRCYCPATMRRGWTLG